jgi:hypothetical protein
MKMTNTTFAARRVRSSSNSSGTVELPPRPAQGYSRSGLRAGWPLSNRRVGARTTARPQADEPAMSGERSPRPLSGSGSRNDRNAANTSGLVSIPEGQTMRAPESSRALFRGGADDGIEVVIFAADDVDGGRELMASALDGFRKA